MEKQTQITAAYAPQPGDFEFLPERDIMTDRNFASLSYWKGVLLHFLKDRKANREKVCKYTIEEA